MIDRRIFVGLLACAIATTLTVTGLTQQPPPPKLGVYLVFVNNEAKVSRVVQGSLAEVIEMERGDKVLKLNDRLINDMNDAAAFLNDCSRLRYVLYRSRATNKLVEAKFSESPYKIVNDVYVVQPDVITVGQQ